MLQRCPQAWRCSAGSAKNARQIQPFFLRAIGCNGVTGIGVAHHPVAGSFQSTRSMRLSAASLPSQTMTMPACCEKPMPTLPP